MNHEVLDSLQKHWLPWIFVSWQIIPIINAWFCRLNIQKQRWVLTKLQFEIIYLQAKLGNGDFAKFTCFIRYPNEKLDADDIR
jgi:hypothetical protein